MNELKRYAVILSDPQDRINLVQRFEKVGQPEAIGTLVIVQTAQPIEAISECPGVLFVEPDSPANLEEWPIRVPQPNMWRTIQENCQWALEWISASPGVYLNTRTGEGVDGYVVDTGVDLSHPEFEGRASTLWSFDGQDFGTSVHGTAVASCMAGKVCGTAKRGTIHNVRVDMWVSSILKGLDRILAHHLSKSADRPSVVNISLSATSSVLGVAVAALTERGIICVAAAGNDYSADNPVHSPTWPARHSSVIEVGALDMDGKPASFSNRGARFWAPGVDVHVAIPMARYHYMSGTSFASPYTAGLIMCQQQFSTRMNSQLAADYAHYLQSLCDNDRIAWFPNGGTAPLTVSTDQPNGGIFPYYVAPSLRFSDDDIAEFCRQYELQPGVIAAEAYSQNVSLARLARCLPMYTPETITQYFLDAGVRPWWVA